MYLLSNLRTWWQQATGEEETPLDGDSPAWLVSFCLHLGLLLVVSLLSIKARVEPVTLTLSTPQQLAEPEIPEEFHFTREITTEVGADSLRGVEIALAEAPLESDRSIVVENLDFEPFEIGEMQFSQEIEQATAPFENEDQAVKGIAGAGTTGASGAIDRITHEILLSLEQRDTLVVWLFDQSGSLERQRKEIRERFGRIYEELGLIREARPELGTSRRPLLTSVVSFGRQVNWPLETPTDDVRAIQQAVDQIQLDESGIENAFSAIYAAADRFRRMRLHEPRRNVMLIAVTDEVGDDQFLLLDKTPLLDRTVALCRRYTIPVYVIGVPAPFGQAETLLKWIDSDPKYDQSPQWARVNQGPESLRPERLQLPFVVSAPDETIDSGFGPFSLTRLCYETGGIYFAVHPNRDAQRRVSRQETAAFSSHLSTFFDPETMRPYRPEYVSAREYVNRVKTNAARRAVVEAAGLTAARMENPTLRFVKRSDAGFANALTEAQKTAAKLEPRLRNLYDILQRGEQDRETEKTLRWQAAYDLAMGQTLAVLVRTRAYNEMLAMAKRGLKGEQPETNTWTLVSDKDVSLGSRLGNEAKKAESYLQRVVSQHPGTPWALVAQRELDLPLGWKWQESVTPIDPPRLAQRPNANSPNPQPPQDEQARMLPKPPPRRAPPRL